MTLSASGKFFHKPAQMNYPHLREGYRLQYPEMGILADNVIGSCHDGTIHKLVVVRILLNEAEAEMWRKEPRERCCSGAINRSSRSEKRTFSGKCAFILIFKNMILA